MKKVIFGLFAVLLLFVAPIVVYANNKEIDVERKIITLSSDEVVDKDYFAAAEMVEIYGTVNGDVYAAGGQVTVDGTVNGDLLVAGGVVNISGEVTQDVRAAGGQININGKVGRNVTVGGGNISFNDPAEIGGSLTVGGGNVSLSAPIGSNVKAGAGNLTVANQISGDLEAAVGTMRLTSKAKVLGDLVYRSEQEASIDENALVEGETVQKEMPKPPIKPPAELPVKKIVKGLAVFYLVVKIISFVSTLIIGLLLAKLFPQYIDKSVDTLKEKPWACLGTGFIALVVAPVLIIALMITVVGIPLGVIILMLYLICLYLAKINVIFWMGKAILKDSGKQKQGWAFVLGLVVYFLLTIVPVFKRLIMFVVLIFGLGTSLLTKRWLYLAARKKDLL